MNKLIGLVIIAAVVVGAALGWQGISLPFLGGLFGGENRTANQIIESVPDTATDQGATQQPQAATGTQPTAQAPATINQAQNNQGTAQAPQTTVGQADTGAGEATEESEPITALW
ncbi:hypothetical protein MC7420_954 [Coleofasciculus chthonoplastes PCC 7420]|uniref:Uncharacterized protein n=1 Tax=Coleofasciculus chthonoplastes PCC 7420 TaxID=118168 RepID=B4W0G4_9CYAN|nr:hypothetical protein [Coleofasciculus chthonoplastes]EDX72285.1 hypothetical protein MC7420_954 [Coleofasciculus chthonoplastes PCC 7420]